VIGTGLTKIRSVESNKSANPIRDGEGFADAFRGQVFFDWWTGCGPGPLWVFCLSFDRLTFELAINR
jgi:hypothetical protein